MREPEPDRHKWKLLERRHVRRGTPIICVANQKGGVGKTTTCVNLATAVAEMGHRVMVADLDPQANATTGLGLDPRSLEPNIYQLVSGEATLDDVVVWTATRGVACLPAAPDLSGAEIELVDAPRREHRLAEAFDEVGKLADLVFIDCPPSLGLLTVNAFVAASDLLVPVQCEYYALEAIARLMDNAERARRSLQPDLRILGFVLTMFDGRTRLAVQVAAEARRHFGDSVFETAIPRSVRLSEAPSFGQPAVTLDPSARGSIAYRELALELVARCGLAGELLVGPAPAESEAAVSRIDEPAPGPHGRGYGAIAVEPPKLDEVWPRPLPAVSGSEAAPTAGPGAGR